MSRPTGAFAFLCFALLLAIWPLTLQRPGLPAGLKADEPAYYLAARSLWEDGDLRCEKKDLERVYDDYLLDPDNLILMTVDDWRTAHYGKPYLASLLAAPLVAACGPNGFFALNMLCLLGSVWLGYLFLRRDNADGPALLFSCGYFLVSTAVVYVFWLQPEVINLASVTAACFLTLYDFEPRAGEAAARGWRRLLASLVNRRTCWWWAGLAIVPAASAKPMYVLALLPGVVAVLLRRDLRGLLALGLATALGVGAVAAGQKALTGTWSPYLGVKRRMFNVRSPLDLPWEALRPPETAAPAAAEATAPPPPPADGSKTGAWGSMIWMFGWPTPDVPGLPRDFLNYFFGRHTGAFVFFPFLALALFYFLAGSGWRDPRRVGGLGALALFVGYFVLWNRNNYHGGAGFIGNRYLISFYPVGLFLVRRLRPAGGMALGFVAGGLFLGQILFASLGPPVDESTLQAYARAIPFRWLPFEFSLPRQIPGYRGVSGGGAYLEGRKDEAKEKERGWLTLTGSGRRELFLLRGEEAATAAFLVRSWAPGNTVRLQAGRHRARVSFPDQAAGPGGTIRVVTLPLGGPDVRHREWPEWPVRLIWYLEIDPSRAARPSWWGGQVDELVGAEIAHIGPREVLERDVYGVEWIEAAVPAEAGAGARIGIPVRLANQSAETWTRQSPVQVHLSYRWLDAATGKTVAEGLRTDLPEPVAPGAEAAVVLDVQVPEAAGSYRLAIEPVYEYVAWFSDRAPNSRLEREVCVEPLEPPGRPAAPPGAGAFAIRSEPL